MPSSDEDEIDRAKTAADQKTLKAEWTKTSRKEVDYGKLSVEALNRHTSSPEFTARYKAWLELQEPKHWTPVARADYEKMCKEDVDPDLLAKCRAELGVTSVAVARAEAEHEKMKTEEASAKEAKRTEPKE